MALKIDWSDEARADIRRLDRPTAMRVFEGILRFARAGQGDLKRLHGDGSGRLRLRIGDYRVLLARIDLLHDTTNSSMEVAIQIHVEELPEGV